eukprot:Plantae.Rhodophyta-Purpureofilum_apyrenoidigerum.ctg31288.p1 GENE.Plantae.Rhodophyta-Purpureofilum_apyrenoidigerum.ctg31288~~Plantae.Rhodophyta-Purpureofilum_apyrenoidigerum.ctg31288.p1  ORF type:complete len:205 (+),score=51.15 Plantae.Rhodophyta-Purpureofilum_apyrenoidigerum.ctg31288:212-826(+)
MVRKNEAKNDAQNPQLRFKSPAEFFAENKNIAGFDNPGKSLYTTIRELVENGLDAAEAVPVLPDITVEIEELTVQDFNKLVGINERERVDESLYKDVETERERKRRQAKELRDAKRRKNSSAQEGKKGTKDTNVESAENATKEDVATNSEPQQAQASANGTFSEVPDAFPESVPWSQADVTQPSQVANGSQQVSEALNASQQAS